MDATLGGGGHALEILKRTSPDGRLIGVDWDEEAFSEARKRLAPFGERVILFRENFVRLPDLLNTADIAGVDGILLDLGLSSIHLDQKERGFSFTGRGSARHEDGSTAKPNGGGSDQAISLSPSWKKSFSITERRGGPGGSPSRLPWEREKRPIQTTEALKEIVHRAIPGRFRSYRIDPATRTFQALRIAVNEELENLMEILETGWRLLKRGGRLCVISFHSLEDRMVKNAFRRLAKGEAEPVIQGAVMHVLTKKPVTPSEEECRRNPRARSAKMRCAERL